ncbi:MAG TPA: hypothetical protein VKZ81_25480 [Pseudonocardia sp.]|uniref:hypothetical protein n=1 Tax=Pseudonocardia sp. TaxID=60912 RepID=UPI002B4B7392|nr:hypothetical protein [Pseudonocardia sp.]HLU58827.1 hypothetical protein [Pseudonocardia sp.]
MGACSDDPSSARDAPVDGTPEERRPAPEWLDPPPRPRVVEDPGILGLSRRARGRWGSRLFNAFFVLVFAVILIQMVSAILENPW